MEIIAFGKVSEDGKKIYYDQKSLEYLNRALHLSPGLHVTVTYHIGDKEVLANYRKAYFAMLRTAADDLGYDSIHDFRMEIQKDLLPKILVKNSKNELENRASIRQLTTATDWLNFLAKVDKYLNSMV